MADFVQGDHSGRVERDLRCSTPSISNALIKEELDVPVSTAELARVDEGCLKSARQTKCSHDVLSISRLEELLFRPIDPRSNLQSQATMENGQYGTLESLDVQPASPQSCSERFRPKILESVPDVSKLKFDSSAAATAAEVISPSTMQPVSARRTNAKEYTGNFPLQRFTPDEDPDFIFETKKTENGAKNVNDLLPLKMVPKNAKKVNKSFTPVDNF